MRTSELIKRYIEDKRYKVLEEDDDYTVFRYQLCAVHALADERDEHFCTVLLPHFDEVTDDNMLDLVVRCNRVSADLKTVKAYVTKNSIVAAVEFFYLDEDDFNMQMRHALQAVVAARSRYEEIIESEE